MTSFLHIEEPAARRPAAPNFALWQLGFRPFYLLASGFAALSIALWALQFAGVLGVPYLAGPMWHAHEMLFGFALAVVVGFLFTAVRNWSGQPTPTGTPLAAIAALWLAGRVLVLTPWGWAAAIVDTAFPLVAAVALAKPLVAGRNRRNYFFVGLLAALGVASLAVHLAQLQVIALPGWIGIQVGLDLVLFIMTVMAGRVVPMFTNNGVPGTSARRDPRIEKAALGGVLALIAADLAGLHGGALAALLALVALAHLARLALWQPWKTLRAPIVWVLHLAYAWIVVHLALRSAAQLGWVLPSLATHALTVGAIGGLTLGMMARSGLGHSGRRIVAGPWLATSFVAINVAAIARTLVPLAVPAHLEHALMVSSLAWMVAFGCFLVVLAPVAVRPRVAA